MVVAAAADEAQHFFVKRGGIRAGALVGVRVPQPRRKEQNILQK